MLWKKARKGPGARLLWAYLAVALTIAVVSPGMAVFADEGSGAPDQAVANGQDKAPDPVPEEAVPTEDVVVEPAVEVAAEPVVEPVAEAPAPAPEPVVAAGVAEEPISIQAPPLPGWDRIDPVPSGTTEYTFGDVHVTIIVYDTPAGEVFDFICDHYVLGVIAKGGTEGEIQTNYPAPGVLHDEGLHAPINPSGFWADLSHIDFLFGEQPPEEPKGCIVVHKFLDANENGTWDNGEDMLEGWTFELKDATGAVIASGQTGADGTLRFCDLPMGDYTVEETLKDGWHNTSGLSVPVTLACAEASAQCVIEPITEHAWFGNARDVYTKTFEFTYEKKPDGVSLFVAFYLNGEYMELDLTGDGPVYSGQVEVPYPYEITGVVWWADGPDGLVALGETSNETLEGDKTNYFEYDPMLGGHKFNDLNNNGVWDAGEPAIEGWTIYLYKLPDLQPTAVVPDPPLGAVLVETTTTGSDGSYLFEGMLPGLYMVAEEQVDGWTPTVWPTDPIMVEHGTDVGDLDFGNYQEPPEDVTKTFELTYVSPPSGLLFWVKYVVQGETDPYWLLLTGSGPYSASIDVPPGTVLTSMEWIAQDGLNEYVLGQTGPEVIDEDMTNYFTYQSHIGGYKFDDYDGNGVWDEGEPPIEGWHITLYQQFSSPPIGAEAIALLPIADAYTDGDGYYSFDGLLPGTYMVQEEDREGWEMTVGPEGTFEVGNGTDRDDLIFGNTEFAPFTELDLAITKLADKEQYDPGELVTYTLTYWNEGDKVAEDFTIVDDFDERYLTIVDSAGGVVADGKITWTLAGPLAKEDGKQTIVYTARVKADMPDGRTNIDNVVEIDHPEDFNHENDVDRERIYVIIEPFLPFTGGEYAMLLGAALAAAVIGLLLRLRSNRAV